MSEKIIRSHRARIKAAIKLIEENDKYKELRISIIDREAFVEFLLLEDIAKLYSKRLSDEEKYPPCVDRPGQMAHLRNIKKFSAMVKVFNAAIEIARAAIDSGNYKSVWKAIHEGALMAAANNVKNLPELKTMAIELLRELSADMLFAQGVDEELNQELDDLEAHEENVRRFNENQPLLDEIEEVIRAVNDVIPDRKTDSKLNTNV